MPTYRKNFIKSVILRFDFNEPVLEFKEAVPDTLEYELLSVLSLKEVHQTKNEELLIDSLSNNITRKSIEIKEFNYYGNEKTKRIALTQNYAFIEFAKYTSYQDFINTARPLLSRMHSLVGASIKRLGFRYINDFTIPNDTLLDWTSYINSKLISNVDLFQQQYSLSRALTIQEYIHETKRILMQYGIVNPDYPGPVIKRSYIFDVDISVAGAFSPCDCDDYISDMHILHEQIFESAILDGMRDYLNA